VQRWALGLREELDDTFDIPSAARMKASLVPALALWAQLTARLRAHPQPRTEVHRYRL
jgi:hypothetical protein